MNMLVIDNEVIIRLAFFSGILALMALLELLVPRRRLTAPKGVRWLNNLILTFFNSLLLRLVFPVTAVGAAIIAADHSWGALNALGVAGWSTGIISMLLLDLTIYAQHFFFHRIRLFWRLHRMHHTDLDIDVTTGARFHPLEIIISMAIKMAVVIALGVPAWAVVVFEVILNGSSMFNHSNIYMGKATDRFMRLLVVTPDMHRLHHSVIIGEQNSNFGFNFPWWDRLFGTYLDQPSAGHEGMTIGLANYRNPRWLRLPWMLALPFRKEP
ncbi:MAG: sterol desaturase family protein [Thermodesulfovibrionales bacterium]|jgi:sterol desaturase/sphingolipid hydroxylase (fatty acid hydroxylase superfamily)